MKTADFDESMLDAVERVEKMCFSHPWTRQNILDTQKNGHSIFLCALENGVVAGYISADAVLETAYINNVAVDPLFRKRGTALSLIAALEERAKEKGCLELTLEVRSGNIPAKKLYEKCGFVPVGVRRGYYSDPTDDAVIMTKRLQT